VSNENIKSIHQKKKENKKYEMEWEEKVKLKEIFKQVSAGNLYIYIIQTPSKKKTSAKVDDEFVTRKGVVLLSKYVRSVECISK